MKRPTARRLGTLIALLLLGAAGSPPVSACAVCYGDAEGTMIKAASMGVWLMVGLVAALQSSFALFFVYLWRRARKLATRSADGDPKESSTS